MKRSRERRTTRRYAVHLNLPPGCPSDEDGGVGVGVGGMGGVAGVGGVGPREIQLQQLQEDAASADNATSSSSAATSIAKRKRARAKSRGSTQTQTRSGAATANDKTAARISGGRRHTTEKEDLVGDADIASKKGPKKSKSDETSWEGIIEIEEDDDDEEENEQIPISQLARTETKGETYATDETRNADANVNVNADADADETDQSHHNNSPSAGPQEPSGKVGSSAFDWQKEQTQQHPATLLNDKKVPAGIPASIDERQKKANERDWNHGTRAQSKRPDAHAELEKRTLALRSKGNGDGHGDGNGDGNGHGRGDGVAQGVRILDASFSNTPESDTNKKKRPGGFGETRDAFEGDTDFHDELGATLAGEGRDGGLPQPSSSSKEQAAGTAGEDYQHQTNRMRPRGFETKDENAPALENRHRPKQSLDATLTQDQIPPPRATATRVQQNPERGTDKHSAATCSAADLETPSKRPWEERDKMDKKNHEGSNFSNNCENDPVRRAAHSDRDVDDQKDESDGCSKKGRQNGLASVAAEPRPTRDGSDVTDSGEVDSSSGRESDRKRRRLDREIGATLKSGSDLNAGSSKEEKAAAYPSDRANLPLADGCVRGEAGADRRKARSDASAPVQRGGVDAAISSSHLDGSVAIETMGDEEGASRTGAFVRDDDAHEREASDPCVARGVERGSLGDGPQSGNASVGPRPQDFCFYSCVSSLKTQLYLEGIKVHRGKGFERRFADYWDALNRYICGNQPKRFSSDRSLHGIEAELKSFLKTKQMKRLHNRVILAIMKQSLQDEVPSVVCKRHLPPRWKKELKMKLVRTSLPSSAVHQPENGNAIHSSLGKRASSGKGKILAIDRLRDRTDILRLRDKFNRDSDVWTSFGHFRLLVSDSSAPSTAESSTDRAMPAASLSSTNLPGALSIDPTMRELAYKENMTVAENAIWLLVVAVRAHASAVLRCTINERKSVDRVRLDTAVLSQRGSVPNRKDEAVESPSEHETKELAENKKGDDDQSRQKDRSVLTVFDMTQALIANPMLASGSANVSMARKPWEDCVSAANGVLPFSIPSRLEHAQSCISEDIEAAAIRRRGALSAPDAESTKEATSPAPAPAPARIGGAGATKGSAAPPPSKGTTVHKTVHGGKDLSTMKRSVELNRTKERRSGTPAENGDAAPSRPTSTSPTSTRSSSSRGRGTGAKNLAAMRAGAKNLAAMRARRTTTGVGGGGGGSSGRLDESDETQQDSVRERVVGQEANNI